MKSNKQVKNKSKKIRKMKGGYDENDDYFFEDLVDFLEHAKDDRYVYLSILHVAVFKGYLNMVEVLLDKNRSEKVQKILLGFGVREVEIDAKDDGNNTPLNYACGEGYMQIVKLLLKNGANVNNRGYMGSTPLHGLFEDGLEGRTTFSKKNVDYFYTSAKFLIDKGADVNAMDDYGSTPLHKHCMHRHIGIFYIVKALLEHGADVNARNFYGVTPLHISCYNIETMEDTLVSEFLISKGANINVKDNQDKTPFEYIKDPKIREWFEKRNLIESLKALNEKKVGKKLLPSEIMRKIREYDGRIDDEAIKVKRDDDLQKEIAFKNFGGKRKTRKNKNKKKGGGKLEIKFFLAVLRDQTELVLSILERGVDIDTKHDDNDHVNWMLDGYTALHYACHHRIGNMVHLLIGEGANMEITDSEGMKPLHIASQKGYIDIIEILLKYGADINMKKGNEGEYMGNESPGATSLHEVLLAFQFITNKFQVVEFLLKNGADINAVDDNGNTPLHYALEFVNVYTDDQYEESIKIANLLINEGADVNASNNKGDTPLHLLLSSEMIYRSYETDVDTLRLIRTIINKGADYEAKNKKGKTPLDYTYEDEDEISYEEWLEFKRVILNLIHNLPKERARRILLEKGSEDTKSILSTLPKEVVTQNIGRFLYGGKRKTKKKETK